MVSTEAVTAPNATLEPTLIDLIIEQETRTPDAIAVITTDETLTYAELGARARGLAARLRELGVGPDSVVGICAHRSAAMMVGLLAIHRAGGAYLPLDPEYPTDRLSYMLTDARVDVVLTHEPTKNRVAELGCPTTIDIDTTTPSDDEPTSGASQDNLAYVIYTSGSTGRPKGACLAHAGIVNRLLWMQQAYPIGPGDAVLQKTPFSFDVSVWELFWPLMTGARLVMARPGGHRDAAYLAATIREHDINVVHFVPSMLAQFLQEPSIREITSLRHVICSGEALPLDVAQRAMALLPGTVENLYGPTEASVDVSYYRCDPETLTTTVPIGRAVANTDLYVLTDDMQLAPDGTPGELYLGGIQLARGYHQRPELTAQRFVPDPFGSGKRLYRTGDIAQWRADGELEYLGRTDHQVKINGFRIELDEIAVALRAHPTIHDAVVVPHTGVSGHQQLVGYVVPVHDAPSPGELRVFLGQTLPAHMVPAIFMAIESIPLSLNGKIDRKLLPTPETRSVADAAPVTDLERRLVDVWRSAFGAVGVDADFLDLGGDSIVALTLVARARAAGLRIGPEQILRHRTIRAIAPHAEQAASEDVTETRIDHGRDTAKLREIAAADDVADVYPLTPLQAGMLFHSQFNEGATDYFQQSVLRMTGPFNPVVFALAWQDVAERHPALRSRVHWADLDRPVQVVEKTVRTPLTIRDDIDDLGAFLAEDRTHGFDPADAPPLRLTLIKGDQWTVVLSHHHLILDGWSMSLVVKELVVRYGQHAQGAPTELVAGPEFRRYVDWIDRQDNEQAATFWHDQLTGHTTPPPLAHSRDHATDTDQIGEIVLRAPQSLRDRARAEGLTLNSVVHGLWGLLLARYGEAHDVVFGSTFSGRPPQLSEVDATVGLFINTLPVHLRVEPDAGLGEWLREVQWRLLDLQNYQHCAIADIRAWSGAASGQNLFDTIVIGQNQPSPEADDPATGLHVTSHDTVTNTGYPLVVLVEERGDQVELLLRYQEARFDNAAVRRIAGHLDAALTAFATNPAQLVGDVPLVTADELAQWPIFGATIPAPDTTIHALVEATAHRVPDAVAVLGPDTQLTFAELNANANRLAHHLRDRGVGPETLVGVCAHRTPQLMVSLLAVLKAGGAYVPLAADNPPERLATIIADSGLSYVIVDDDLRSLVTDAELIAPDSGTDESDPTPLSTPDNIAYVIYTSGSSGKPKGVAVPHRGVVNHLRWCLSTLPADARGGAPIFSSFGFDLIVPSLYTPLVAGQPVRLLPDGLDAGQLADQLADGAPYSFIKLTPGLLELLAEHLTPEQAANLASVLLVGGEAFPDRVRATWHQLAPGTTIINHYGPTEVSVGASSFRTSAEPTGTTLVPIGRPHQNQNTYLLDDRLQPVPVGVPGEIYVGGIGNARGYLNRPGLTAEKFVPDLYVPGSRMYRTGDRATRLPSGDLLFLGRRDGQVKIRGYRVELGEIERTLAGHPALRHAVVAAPTDETGRQRLVAYAVGTATGPELRSWLADRLPPYLVPATYLLLDEFPLTPNGKVDRKALPAPEAIDRTTERAYVEPRGEVEQRLAASWAHVLRVERVGAHDNFFELGGDSIMTLQIVANTRQAGWKISPKLIFQYPTIAQLAPHATPIATTVRAAMPTGEWFPLAPIQRAFLDRDLPDHNHYNQSVVLDITDADPTRLAGALQTVVANTPALRTRFGANGQRVIEREDAELLWLDADPDAVQASLDIANGPLIRAGLTGDQLLIAVHHLVVDTLSWRPLIEDLAAAYEGKPLGQPTSSYQDWVSSLADTTIPALPGSPLPCDPGPDTVGSAASLHVQLSEADTERLLRDAPRAHRIRVEDVILTAAARTFAVWLGGPATIDVERHGRDGAPDDLDLSRTVGWFTQVLPLRIDDLALSAVKEQLRALPAQGSAASVSPVVVNYHGRVDRSIPDVGPFTVSSARLGSEKNLAYPRPRPIEIEAGVRDGMLDVEWIYPANRLRADTVQRLADAFLAHLRDLIQFCVENPGGYTPSDFPLVRLSQREVDRLGSDVEDVYPLTAMQEGLLFHSLFDPDDDMYLGRRTYRLDGRIDLDAFARAWCEVGRRHPILRSTIVWEGVDQPVQVVRSNADISVVETVRDGGFDLAAAPPIEVALRPNGDVVLSYHHIIVDGWSVSTIVTEVMDTYHALLSGSPERPEPAPPFRHFVQWLNAADPDVARRYWHDALGDVTQATTLPLTGSEGSSSATVDVALSASLHETVRGFLTGNGLTLATLAQGAWAMVLADRTGRDDVLFGSTVAIRPGELANVGRMVGPLINTLPVRVRVDRNRPTRDWLAELQRRYAELREYAASSLTDIHQQTGLPADQQLFDNILVVENFPRPVIAGPAASLTAVREFERTGYPVVLGVIDADPIRVQVLYEQSSCDANFARELADQVIEAFARLS
ncbi:MAG TPA: amino acid adenylation domain-containing protein [Pseudonocardiaceae bacterium]